MEMTLIRRPAPHVRHSDSITISMADVTIALLPCIALAWYYYGLRLLINCGVSVLTTLVTELIMALLSRRKPTVGDLSAVVTGIIVAMLLPVGIPYRYIVLASVAAIAVAKWMFGGVGKNIFNPALCGVTLATLVNTMITSVVYAQGAQLPLYGPVPEGTPMAEGILTQLKGGETVTTSLFDAFVGRQAGIPAGVCVPLLLIAGAYLMYRRIVSPYITVSLLATVTVAALLFPRAGTPLISAGYELVCGSLIFCTVFCANDPVTTPNTATGQMLFGVFTGIITMLIRYFGNFDEGVIFAILIMNSTSFALDKFMHKLHSRRRGGN